MSQLIKRLLVFFIGIPLVVSLALFDFYNHLPLLLAIVIVIFLAARELYSILKDKLPLQPRWLFFTLITMIPIFNIIVILTGISTSYINYIVVIILMTSFTYEVFSIDNTNSFDNAVARFSTTAFSIVYLGVFSSFVSQLTLLPNSSIYIVTFLLMVFGCDSLAWFFGMTLGRKTRGFVKASPNKSIVGFIGGLFGSVLAGLIMYYFFSHVFGTSPVYITIVGLMVAIASIIGDLIESVIKRSCAHKDSDIGGVGVPGRGGFLDSIDSILFSAPIYYILVTMFFI